MSGEVKTSKSQSSLSIYSIIPMIKDEMKMDLDIKSSTFSLKRIWAGDHADAPAARTGCLLEAEEDHRYHVRVGHN